MDAQALAVRPRRNAGLNHAIRPLVAPTVVAAIAIGAIAAGLLLWRRLDGAVALPVSTVTLAITGLVLAGFAVAMRLSWFYVVQNRLQSFDPFTMADYGLLTVPALSVIATVASLSIPGTSPLGLLFLWSFPLCVEFATAFWVIRRRNDLRHRLIARPSVPEQPFDSADEPPPELPEDDQTQRFDPPHEPPTPHWPDRDVSQQLIRRRSVDGVDSIHLWVRADIQAGARSGQAHLAFCPPFDTQPEVLLEQADGPEASIKLGEILPYGARIDLKLASVATSDQSLLLEVFVQQTKPVTNTEAS